MRANGVMDQDVDLEELAVNTKNFSGAEIGGLIKSATSFAFNRHVKVPSELKISEVRIMDHGIIYRSALWRVSRRTSRILE